MLYNFILARVTIAVIKYNDQKHLGRRGFILLTFPESQSIEGAKAGAQTDQELIDARRTAYWLAPPSFL